MLLVVKCGKNQLEELVEARLGFLLAIHPELTDLATLRDRTRSYLANHLATGRYLGYFGLLQNEIVCTAGLLLYELPPILPDAPDRRVGHVLNFFTVPVHRRRGFGRQLLEFMKSDAAACGLSRLVLHAMPMGEPLYRNCGFHEQEDKELVLNFA